MNIYKVYFEKISQYYEGVLVRNWEALEWMKSKGYKGRFCQIIICTDGITGQ